MGMPVRSHAGAVITSGAVSMGINDTGELNFGFNSETGLPFGIALAGLGDGISPGCYCEGWGVAVNGSIAGGASQSNADPGNLTLSSFTSTASTATSVVTLTSLPTLSVSQAYAPSASSALFENTVTITNTGAGAVSDLLYTRVMDWDIPPTEFSEMVTLQGVGATNLVLSHDDGFANVDPLASTAELVPGTTNVNFIDSGPADHGAYFKFNFGSLAADSSKTFSIFYGAAGSETAALAALGTVGAEVYSLGQSDGTVSGSDFVTGTPGTFIFGFKGVGGTPLPPPNGTVPEPSALLLSLLGLGTCAFWLRKRNAS
jgi:type IV pilus assembly protein PilY1